MSSLNIEKLELTFWGYKSHGNDRNSVVVRLAPLTQVVPKPENDAVDERDSAQCDCACDC